MSAGMGLNLVWPGSPGPLVVILNGVNVRLDRAAKRLEQGQTVVS